MAQIIWTDKPEAARRLVQRVFKHVEQLATHPKKRVSAAGTPRLALAPDHRAALPSLTRCLRRKARYPSGMLRPRDPRVPADAAHSRRHASVKEWVDKNASLLELEDTGSFYCWSVPR
jgi:plasmid stabilization system protein ParE